MSLFGLLPLLIGLLPLIVAIALCVHVVRTNSCWLLDHPDPVRAGAGRRGLSGRDRDPRDGRRDARPSGWAWPPAMPWIPDARIPPGQGRPPTTARRCTTACDLAAAAASLGRHAEAEQLYGEATQGIHADDPALLLGRANALIELGRAPRRYRWSRSSTEEQGAAAPATALAQGRAYEGARPLRGGGRAPISGPPDACRGWRRWAATPPSWPASAARPRRRQPRRDRPPHRARQSPVPPRRPRLARPGRASPGAGRSAGLERTAWLSKSPSSACPTSANRPCSTP